MLIYNVEFRGALMKFLGDMISNGGLALENTNGRLGRLRLYISI